MRKRRYIILISVILSIIASIIISSRQKPVYRATAAVELKGMLENVGRFFSYDLIAAEVSNETKIMVSYPIIIRAARSLGDIPKELTLDEVINSDRYMGTAKGLKARVKVGLREQSAIMNITAVSYNPERAKDMANAVAEAYIEYRGRNIGDREKEMESFVRSQRANLVQQIKEAERKVMDFKVSHGIFNLDPQMEDS